MPKPSFGRMVAPQKGGDTCGLKLINGSRIAIVGGGPAGSFMGIFLRDMAERIGLEIEVDLYESRDFTEPAPAGCNMCGGIISESLLQALAMDGITLAASVVQRGIDSYNLHMDVGSLLIETPLKEKKIAAVHRSVGPRGNKEAKWGSFDAYLQGLAAHRGVHLVAKRVKDIAWQERRPLVVTEDGPGKVYDLLVAASGVNSATLKLLEKLGIGYRSPGLKRAYICEYYLGRERVNAYLGNSMHVFLPNIPKLEFAAIIPKGDYATVCLLGRKVDKALVRAFLNDPLVVRCMPPDWSQDEVACRCFPSMNVKGVPLPFSDRVVLVGDCGVTRLYKDGIGAAYRTAKAAATTAVLHGISAADFRRHYRPACRAMAIDNVIGKFVFAVTRLIQKTRFARRAILRMASAEQKDTSRPGRMSTVLWDTFTGSAPYREILLRICHPAHIVRLLGNLMASLLTFGKSRVPWSGEARPR